MSKSNGSPKPPDFPREEEFVDFAGRTRKFSVTLQELHGGYGVYAVEDVEGNDGYEFRAFSSVDPFHALADLRKRIPKLLSTRHLVEKDGRFIGGLMETATRWYHYIAYFFGGAFLANTIPHLVNGISGSPFQSPFASPPGDGLSSSTVNVLWGLFNLIVAYVLVARIGRFELRQIRHAVVLGLGVLLMALMLARAFGKFHGGSL